MVLNLVRQINLLKMECQLRGMVTLHIRNIAGYMIGSYSILFWTWDLKELCHAISADCLLIEATHAHAVNEYWVWLMDGKFVCTFKSACWGSLCWAFDFLGIVYALDPILISILTLEPSITADCRLFNSTVANIFALHMFDLCVLPWTIPWCWECSYMYFLCPL